MVQKCSSGKISRSGACKRKPGEDFPCNEYANGTKRTKKSCERYPKECIWIPTKCVKDTGAKGRTPEPKRWIPKEFKGDFPIDMPFNEPLAYQREQCRMAGNILQKENIEEETAKRRARLPYNMNERLADPNAADWDKQRDACIEGIEAAYSR